MSLIRARYRAVNTIMNLPRGGYVGLLDLYPNAAAAYSLRKLRAAYSGAAVRVRRSSDNTEQDIAFDANGDLDTASLLSFVNEDVDVYTSDFSSTENLSEFNGTGAAAQSVGGVDDAYKFTLSGGGGSHFAFRNIHEVGKSYEISFDVYVPSGNSAVDGVLFSLFGAQDIIGTNTTDEWVTLTATYSANYTNGNFYAMDGGSKTVNADGDVFYLKNIVVTQTTADGFVTVWYDQSLSNDATQATAANQPKIVSAGSLVTENGNVAIDFDGADDYLTLGGTNDAGMLGDISVFSVNKNLGTSTSVVISTGLTGSSSALVMQWSLTGGTSNQYIGTTSDGTTRINENVTATNYGSQVLVSMINDESGNLQLFADGVGSTGQTAVAPMNDANYALQVGRDTFRAAYNFSGTMQELILYSSLPNRTAIETNINNFYSIYP